MVDNIDSDFSLYWKNILFGFFNNNCYTINELWIIDLDIILAKFHIHKSKFRNSKPLMIIFENENKQYIKILFKSKIRKLLKLLIYVLCIFI